MADAVDDPATSLDNQFVASERDKAQTIIIGATGQEAAVMADADNLAADTPANTSVAAVDMSTLAQRGQGHGRRAQTRADRGAGWHRQFYRRRSGGGTGRTAAAWVDARSVPFEDTVHDHRVAQIMNARSGSPLKWL